MQQVLLSAHIVCVQHRLVVTFLLHGAITKL